MEEPVFNLVYKKAQDMWGTLSPLVGNLPEELITPKEIKEDLTKRWQDFFAIAKDIYNIGETVGLDKGLKLLKLKGYKISEDLIQEIKRTEF
jgi:hypothetical protein